MKKLIKTKITTTPEGNKHTSKPEVIKKKMPIKVVKKVKIPRGAQPNLKFAESKAAQNDEAVMRKEDRQRKGL